VEKLTEAERAELRATIDAQFEDTIMKVWVWVWGGGGGADGKLEPAG
jgi:hypothetical protein